MFLPCGADWAHSFETTTAASDLAARLADAHGFTRSTPFQPFGAGAAR